ncbi:MAG: hypothetical protein JXB45_02105, partial [Candidatus Krumholzibacteriota bacterium]|nr:hypothetical protein [Candidatus Krumholzibacteriota bacterium]
MRHGGTWWRISRIAENDFRLTWKERSVVIWIFLMPLAFMFFFGLSFRGPSAGGRPKASLTVDNKDPGSLSPRLLDLLRLEHIDLRDSSLAGEEVVRTLEIPA